MPKKQVVEKTAAPKKRGRPAAVKVPKVKAPLPAVTTTTLAPQAPARLNAQGKRVVNYCNNADMLKAVIASKEAKKMNDTLAKMVLMLVDRYASKGNFSGYTYNDEMRGFAIMMLMRTWASFNENKSSNPFAYYTQCIKNSFIQYLKSEKKNQRIRDELMMDAGYMPSYAYQDDYARRIHDEYGDSNDSSDMGDGIDHSYKPDAVINRRTSEAIEQVFDDQLLHTDITDGTEVEGMEEEVLEIFVPTSMLDDFDTNITSPYDVD